MTCKEKLIEIAANMIANNPRILEYNMTIFKQAVKAQEGIELTNEEAIEVGKLMFGGRK